MLFRPDSGSATISQRAATISFAELVAKINYRPPRRPRRRYRSRRRKYENGVCRAARRAFSAALMYRQNPGLTLKEAAELTGSNAAYAAAADVVLQAEDRVLQDAVLASRVPLLTAAVQAKAAANLVTAYRQADHEAKLAFAAAISPEAIWDETVVPALGTKPASTIPTVEDVFAKLRHAA